MARKKADNSNGNGLTGKSLSFYKKRTCWYAEVPQHTEDQNLMVSGADVMCELMADGHKRVTIKFMYGNTHSLEIGKKSIIHLSKIQQSNYGATYTLESQSVEKLPETAWLCNVTRTVCGGSHPDHIYVQEITPNDEKPYLGKLPW